MGQVTQPASGQIIVQPTDREGGPGAGSGASGNRCIFLGSTAGQNSTVSDVLAIGNAALAAGMADANSGTGVVAIGSQALKALTGPGVAAVPRPTTALGYSAGSLVTGLSAAVIIGDFAYSGPTGNAAGNAANKLVCIGSGAMQNTFGNSGTNSTVGSDCVVIGARAFQPLAQQTAGAYAQCQQNVIIGSESFYQVGGSQNILTNNVAIGYRTYFGSYGTGNVTNNVAIGASVGSGAGLSIQNVLVGSGVLANSASCQDNVFVGYNVANNDTPGNNNVAIGSGVRCPSGSPNTRQGNIIIGAGANTGVTQYTDTLLIETNIAGTKRTLVFGDLNAGNMIIGNSTDATNRDMKGTNTLKLLNGTANGAATGGGYFYVNAGALHWVGSAGTDTTIAPA